MKPLFVPLFLALAAAALTAAVHADPYIFQPVRDSNVPVNEWVTIYEIPSYSVPNSIVTIVPDTVYIGRHSIGEQFVSPVPYTAAKPTGIAESTEMPVIPSQPLAPLLPMQDPLQFESEIIRGQTNSVETLAEFLGSQLPLPAGAVEEGVVDQKLLGDTDSPESGADPYAEGLGNKSDQEKTAGQGIRSADPLGYTMLLTAMAITTIGLVYMAFVAYDYRQRWMQSLVTQNDRYLGGGAFDLEMEDTYSGSLSFSEGLGLTHRSV